jgi:hypothetical protein
LRRSKSYWVGPYLAGLVVDMDETDAGASSVLTQH